MGSEMCIRDRVKDNLILEPVKDLPDGSFLADVFDSITDRRRRHPARVRVISYTIEDGRDPSGPFRLITTLLDHAKAPAAQLAAAYAQRGRSRAPSTSSRPTSVARASCCAPSPRSWSPRRSGATCAVTTRSAP